MKLAAGSLRPGISILGNPSSQHPGVAGPGKCPSQRCPRWSPIWIPRCRECFQSGFGHNMPGHRRIVVRCQQDATCWTVATFAFPSERNMLGACFWGRNVWLQRHQKPRRHNGPLAWQRTAQLTWNSPVLCAAHPCRNPAALPPSESLGFAAVICGHRFIGGTHSFNHETMSAVLLRCGVCRTLRLIRRVRQHLK